jgi:hypothetical protein
LYAAQQKWGRLPMQHYQQKPLQAPQAEEGEAEQLNVGSLEAEIRRRTNS